MQGIRVRLNEFLKGVDIPDFFSTLWGRAPYHFHEAALSLDHPERLLESLLSLPRLRYPQVRVLNAGGALNPMLYTASSRFAFSDDIVHEKIRGLAVAPNTIKIENLASLDPVFDRWSNQLALIFSSRITLNAYFSFGPSDGIPTHYDPHHIFALQLYGAKDWKLGIHQSDYFPHNALTMPDLIEPPPTEALRLRAGEMLYVPPGRLHSVRTEKQSVHVTVGVHTPRCFQEVARLLEQAALRHAELRADMPATVDSESLRFSKFTRRELDAIFQLILAENSESGL